MKKFQGIKIVQYHELYNYFLKRYHLQNVIDIEPLPGINPSSRHTFKVIKAIKKNGVKLIFQDVYHSKKVAKYIASKTGAKVVLMPHDIGALKNVDSLEKLYNTLVLKVIDNG